MTCPFSDDVNCSKNVYEFQPGYANCKYSPHLEKNVVERHSSVLQQNYTYGVNKSLVIINEHFLLLSVLLSPTAEPLHYSLQVSKATQHLKQ